MNDIIKSDLSESKLKNISDNLSYLSVIYYAQSHNYSEDEAIILNLIWVENFKNIEMDIFTEAVNRFIKNDKKGFFPVPGQIMGYVEEINEERHNEKYNAVIKIQKAKIEEIEKLKDDNGDYSNCVFYDTDCEYKKNGKCDIDNYVCLRYQRKDR